MPPPAEPLEVPHERDNHLATKSRWIAEHGTTVFLGVVGPRVDEAPTPLESLRQFESDVLPFIPAESCLPAAVLGFFANGGRRCYVLSIAESLDGITVDHFYEGVDHRGGLAGAATLRDASLICAPDVVRAHQLGLVDATMLAALQDQLVSFCEMQASIFAIMDPPANLLPVEIQELRNQTRSTGYAALYYPWVRPTRTAALVPPSGHVAGMFARADTTVGPHSAPLQVGVRDVAELAVELGRNEMTVLWPSGINPIAATGSGFALHSARTLSDQDDQRKVPWVRTLAWITRNVSDGMGWASRASAGDRQAWRQFGHDLEDLFDLMWRGGALTGETSDDAYRVRCDPDSTTIGGDPLNRLQAEVQLSLQGPMSCRMRVFCQLD